MRLSACFAGYILVTYPSAAGWLAAKFTILHGFMYFYLIDSTQCRHLYRRPTVRAFVYQSLMTEIFCTDFCYC
ncbi:hypothetical protein BDW66DRAFT_137254 [Aspergillus desertorum]